MKKHLGWCDANEAEHAWKNHVPDGYFNFTHPDIGHAYRHCANCGLIQKSKIVIFIPPDQPWIDVNGKGRPVSEPPTSDQ